VTRSPRTATPDAELPFCGEADAALARVADRVARREALGLPQRDAAELAFTLRAEGGPYVWPHAWTLSATAPSPEDVAARLRRFLGSFSDGGVRRCGIARRRSKDGAVTVAAVVVGALADLDPLPTHARVGQWVKLRAHMLVPASASKLVVLGPLGAPRTVPTTLHGDRVEATFAVDHEGPWSVQLLASVDVGPRPVLEATIFVDVPTPTDFAEWPAPGEDAGGDGRDPHVAVGDMVNNARRADGLPSLRRSDALDRVAALHAEAMQGRGLLAHDAGDGDPIARLRRAGIEPSNAGENVAHALSIQRAHRALWASPSHRGNLLDRRFSAIGIGVVPDPDGSVWVCEVFGDFDEAGNGAPRAPPAPPAAPFHPPVGE
jgi:uncharacterized protein YkwD